MDRKEWSEFQETGLLWLVNTVLNLFGWEIVVHDNVFAYPARTKSRGYSEKGNSDGYARVTNYLKDNIEDLFSETNANILDWISQTNIEKLNLDVRACNCLARAGIQTIGDLLARDDWDLIHVRSLGRHSLQEIMDKRQTVIEKYPSIPHKECDWSPETNLRCEKRLEANKEKKDDGERISEPSETAQPENQTES